MSTDLVVMPEPETLDTYKDLLNRDNMTVNWVSLTSEHLDFMNAEPGSVERRLWEEKKALFKALQNLRQITVFTLNLLLTSSISKQHSLPRIQEYQYS